MNNKILLSMAIIGAVVVSAIGGTMAYFSDTEKSNGNTFTAGTLDLKINNDCHYNGMVCANGFWVPVGGQPTTKPCDCNWLATDLTNQLFFNFSADPSEIGPKDEGEDTVSLHANGNPSWVCLKISDVAGNENGCSGNEADPAIDPDCVTDPNGIGELLGELKIGYFLDFNCNNAMDGNDYELTADAPIANGIYAVLDSTTQNGGIPTGPLNPNDQNPPCVGMKWNLAGAGNEIEGDSVTAKISFIAQQWRNNTNFQCSQLTP